MGSSVFDTESFTITNQSVNDVTDVEHSRTRTTTDHSRSMLHVAGRC